MQYVPPREWRSFLERFSRQHRAGLGTMHWVPAAGTVLAVQGVALESVSFADRKSRNLVRLSFLDGHSLSVERPRVVRVEQTTRGAERALEMETATGGLLRLAFRAARLPEELDGLAPGEIRDERASQDTAESHRHAS